MEDIAPTDKFSINIELRVCWPFAVNFYLFPDYIIFQNVNRLVFSDAIFFKDLDHKVGVSASGRLRIALHEKHDFVILHPFVNKLVGILSGQFWASL